MRPFRPIFVLALLASLALAPAAAAEDWPHWRGPHLDGTSDATGLPTTWSATAGDDTEEATENVLWRYDLPGPAGSTPVVWDDTIYLTTTVEGSDELRVIALGTDGSLRWEAKPDAGKVEVFEQFRHETNAAAPSPVTDGDDLWVLFGSARLFRIALGGESAGEVTLTVDLAERYGMPSLYFGVSTSPLLHEGRIYLQLLHAEAQLVVALDAATGEEVWAVERPSDAKKESRQSYASVIPFPADEPTHLLVHGADYLTAHDLDTGAETWRFGSFNPEATYNPSYRLVATPVVHGDLVVIPTAKRGPVFGLRPGDAEGTMEPGSSRLAWTLERGTPDVPSPVVGGGLVYLAGENGRLEVLDVETGEEVYAERVHQSPHRGSPILADGKLYLTGTDGTVSVVAAGREFEILSKNSVDAGRLAATPAVGDGVLYLRTYDALFAVGERDEADDADDQSRSSSSR